MPAPTKYGDSTKYMEFSLDAAEVPVNDTNVCACLVLSAAAVAACNRADGLDCVVTLADGTLVVREMRNFSKANSTGILWFQIPAVSTVSGGTTLYIQLGGATVNEANSTAVWANMYGGANTWSVVSHADDDVTDSGTTGNHGTFNGSAAYGTTSQFGYEAIQVAGDSDYTSFPHNANLAGGNGAADFARTILGWWKVTNYTTNVTLAAKGIAIDTVDYWFLIPSATRKIQQRSYDGVNTNYRGRSYDTALGDTGAWRQYAATYAGANPVTTSLIYRQGTQIDDTQITSGSYTAMDGDNDVLSIGRNVTTYSSMAWAVFRIGQFELSANQILGSYNIESQAATNGAFTVGALTAFAEEDAWKPGLLGPKDFSPLVESADLLRGGGVAHVGSVKVSISNVSKLHVAFAAAGVKLNGRPAEIWEFEVVNPGAPTFRVWGLKIKLDARLTQDTDIGLYTPTGAGNSEIRLVENDLDELGGVVTPYVMRYGICGEPTWTETNYEITIEDADYKRNAPMGTIVDEQGFPSSDEAARGHMVPMTFGELRPRPDGSADMYAKLLRTTNKESEFTTGDDANIDLGYDGLGQHILIWNLDKNNREFPIVGIVGSEPSLVFKVYFNSGGAPLFVDGLPAMADVDLDFYFAGKLIEIVSRTASEGEADMTGQRRRIEHATYKWDTVLIEFTVADHWNGYPRGNTTATHTNQTWVRILDADAEYDADVWPCDGFIDSLGAAIVGGHLELYAFTQSQSSAQQGGAEYSRYWRLPGHALSVSVDGDQNHLLVDMKQTEGTLDNLVAFETAPVKSVFLYGDPSPANRFLGTPSAWIKLADGFYRYGGAVSLTSMTLTNEPDARDRVRASYAQAHAVFGFGGPGVEYFIILFAVPPDLPANMTFDAVYVGASIEQYVTEHDHLSSAYNCQMLFEWHRFLGVAQQCFDNYEVFGKNPGTSGDPRIVDTMPDFFYLSDPGYHNEYFYVPVGVNPSGNPHFRVSGYVAMPLDGITTPEQYHSVRFLSLRSRVFYSTPGAWYDNEHVIKIREWCVIFKKSVNIGEAIYSPFRGRIYNDTWGARRTAANLIEDPVDVVEHALRCQNWSEAGASEPAAGWGKAYCGEAKIDTSTDPGGLEAENLDGVRSLCCARQVLDYDESYTRPMVESLCEDFFLLQFKRHFATVASEDAGKECLLHLLGAGAPVAALTLADVQGEIEPLQEPRARDIYCEPLVRFCWNPGRGKFDRVIQITHSSVGAWQASYTPGFDGGEGEYFYDLCHALWNEYGQLNAPPSDLTDKYWIRDYQTAKQYLEWWIRWQQLRRVSFAVPYVTGRAWHVGTRVTVSLPHHTNGVALNAMVEALEKNKHENYVRCTFILLDQIVTEPYYLQDTWESVTEDWQDTWDDGAAGGQKQKSM